MDEDGVVVAVADATVDVAGASVVVAVASDVVASVVGNVVVMDVAADVVIVRRPVDSIASSSLASSVGVWSCAGIKSSSVVDAVDLPFVVDSAGLMVVMVGSPSVERLSETASKVVEAFSAALSVEESANPNMSLNSGLVTDSVLASLESSTASVTPNMSLKPSSDEGCALSVDVDSLPSSSGN